MKTKLLTILLLFALAIPAPIRAAEQEEDPSLGEMISMLWEHRDQVGEKLAPEQMKAAKEIEELPHRKALMALCAIFDLRVFARPLGLYNFFFCLLG